MTSLYGPISAHARIVSPNGHWAPRGRGGGGVAEAPPLGDSHLGRGGGGVAMGTVAAGRWVLLASCRCRWRSFADGSAGPLPPLPQQDLPGVQYAARPLSECPGRAVNQDVWAQGPEEPQLERDVAFLAQIFLGGTAKRDQRLGVLPRVVCFRLSSVRRVLSEK